MSHAIITTGGKQYLVQAGDTVLVERLSAKLDETVDFEDALNGKKVSATLIAEVRAPKIDVRKFKSKVRYLRRKGHRQSMVKLRIEKIS